MSHSYEQTYQAIVHKLAGCDLGESAARLGLPLPVGGIIKTLFLGREYEISSKGVTAADGLPSNPNCRSTLIYYVTSRGKAEPEYSYSLLHSFIPGPRGGLSISWMTAPLVRKFRNDYAGFCSAMKLLGALCEESPKRSEHVWSYRILPKIPMQIIYSEADEEFPCEIKLKLDNNSGRFMEFEQLAFLCGCLVNTLAKELS